MKRIVFIGSVLLVLMILGSLAAPVLAADPAGSPPAPANGLGRFGRAVLLQRLLLVQDEAKIDTMLADAVKNVKITTEQATKIKAYWTLHHEKAIQRPALRGLMRIQDEAKLNDLLNQGLSSGRITKDQAGKIIAAWEKLHAKK